VGCCVSSMSSGGTTTKTGACIYDPSFEATEMTACSDISGTWQTTAP
jgi:hypothetical protein